MASEVWHQEDGGDDPGGGHGERKDVYDLDMKEGRFFTDADKERAANVIVLGYDTADTLFGTRVAMGKDVTIAGMVFTVVGVMDKQKQAFGGGKNPQDNKAFFPVTTFHKMHPEVLDYWISLKYDDQKNKALVEDELTELLRRRRKVLNEKPDNFCHLRDRHADAAVGPDYVRAVPAAVLALERGAAGGRRGRDEHHAGERDGANAGDRRAQGDRRDQADDPDAVHAGGDHAVRGRRRDRHLSGQRDRAGLQLFVAVAAVSRCGSLWRS